MISVIMGLHKIDEYVDEAINSILNQTYYDFEFIIVANGIASDEVARYINSSFNDSRIKVLQSPIGQLAHALNLAIDVSQYDYIARMDGDDIAHPERLEKQLSYIQLHELDLVGSNVNLINESGLIIGSRTLSQKEQINKKLPYKSTFVHPSILCLKQVLLKAKGYNAGFNSEDYDLWLRLKRQGVKWDNIQEKLLNYRIHSTASQRRLLGYAECAGYSVREFLLQKNLTNFTAIFVQFFKSIIRPDRSKKD